MQCMATKIAQVLVAHTCTFLPLANVRYTRYRAHSRDDCPGDDCETAWKSTQNNLDLRFQSRRSPSILHVWLPWSRIRFGERSIVAVPVGGWFGGHSMSRGGGTWKVCLLRSWDWKKWPSGAFKNLRLLSENYNKSGPGKLKFSLPDCQ